MPLAAPTKSETSDEDCEQARSGRFCAAMSNDDWDGSVAMHKALKALATSSRPISASRVKTAAATAMDNVKVIDPSRNHNNLADQIKQVALRLSVSLRGGVIQRHRGALSDACKLVVWAASPRGKFIGPKDGAVSVLYTVPSI